MIDIIPLTVVIPVKNEEVNLAKCLRALKRFSHVVVVDSGSTDRTPEIAEDHGAELINFKWDGKYPKKRNWFLQTYAVKTDWVLFLDADEIVNSDFCNEVRDSVLNAAVSGFWLNYTNYFLGKPLRYGLAQRKLALFRVGSGSYERIEEDQWSKLDMEIHEHPIINGTLGEIAAQIDHNDDRGVAKFIERHKDYALWEAKRIIALKVKSGQDAPHLTDRQRFKYRHLTKWWYPGFYFVYTYIIKRGFLDGAAGFYYALYKAWYFLTVRLLVQEQASVSPDKK